MTVLPRERSGLFVLPIVIALLAAGWTGDLRAQAAERTDPAASRLFFVPTGRTLPRGEAQRGAYMVFPFGTYAVTDRFMISGGTPLYPELTGRMW
ncbi:MAG TPA: hypothetical protein VKZ58_05310 [Longimicrobiales bacterium]|nr:hypothetical protein [Longimicrobiales bacterium]